MAPSVPMTPVNSAPHSSANTITSLRAAGDNRLTKTSTPTVDSRAHAERGAKLRHPHEHIGGELPRPGQVDGGERGVDFIRCPLN